MFIVQSAAELASFFGSSFPGPCIPFEAAVYCPATVPAWPLTSHSCSIRRKSAFETPGILVTLLLPCWSLPCRPRFAVLAAPRSAGVLGCGHGAGCSHVRGGHAPRRASASACWVPAVETLLAAALRARGAACVRGMKS